VSEPNAVRVIVLGATLTVLGALSFMLVYSFGGDVVADGACAALMFVGIAVSFLTWATTLLEPKRVVEERDVAPSSVPFEGVLGETFVAESQGLSRPKLFAGLSAAAAGTLGVAAIFPLRSLSYPPATGTPPQAPWQPGTRLVDESGVPLRAQELDVGSIATAFPEGAIEDPTGSIVVIRLDPRIVLHGARADWAPRGYIAFSKICTHVGCPVALYRRSEHELLCPCHQSRFDVLDGAKPVGGPASRPLPQLALQIDADGTLRARHGFAEPVGPAAWTTQ
jgi:ubiquinol-cytochrome c reductase iron-sulfur subunit